MNTPFITNHEIELYKRFLEPTNPYVAYNNLDRMLNVPYRIYTGKPGGWGVLERGYTLRGNTGDAEKLNFAYERQSMRTSQYFWASTSLLGVGYASVRPELRGTDEGDDDKDRLAKVILARAVINATLETTLLLANGIRYGEIFAKGFLAPVRKVWVPQSAIWTWWGPLPPAKDAVFHAWPADGLGPRRPIPGWVIPADYFAKPFPGQRPFLEIDAKFVLNPLTGPYRNLWKNVRSYLGSGTSAGFAANAVISVGIQSKVLHNAIHAESFNGYVVASASLGLTVAISNVFANTFKSAASFGSTRISPTVRLGGVAIPGIRSATVTRFGSSAIRNLSVLGTVAGVIHGVAGMVTLFPLLISKGLSAAERGVIAAEMGAQVIGGGLMVASNIMLALQVAKGISSAARLGGPVGLAFAGALTVALSPLEIYGMVQQSRYADRLDELNDEMSRYGYEGHGLLADFYDKKTRADAGILAATATLTFIGAAVAMASIMFPPFATVGLVVSLVTGLAALGLKLAQPAIIEGIARDFAEKIEAAGGAAIFFGKELEAQHQQILYNAADHLRELQADFGVDSVVAVTTPLLSRQALEFAALTGNLTNLRTTNSYIDRVVGGVVKPDQSLGLDMQGGAMRLGGEAGKKQLLAFLTPLMAAGETKTTTVSTGKDAYKTSLEWVNMRSGWNIYDGIYDNFRRDSSGATVTSDETAKSGNASSTMDVRKVVSSVADDAGNLVDVRLQIFGYGGDDTVITGASGMSFDGGAGKDLVSYGGLNGDSSITVIENAEGGFTVTKRLLNMDVYRETTAWQEQGGGKTSNSVEYRTFELSRLAAVHTVTDYLIDVENIRGGTGDDYISGNNGNNMLDGGAGSDQINGGGGNDRLFGGAGGDLLHGGDGNDVMGQDMGGQVEGGGDRLYGDAGIDTVDYSIADITGRAPTGIVADLGASGLGEGTAVWVQAGTSVRVGATGRFIRIYHNDAAAGTRVLTYLFGRGGGADVVVENDATPGNKDSLRFGASIDASQVWFSKVNTTDLRLSLIGTDDSVTFRNWYSDMASHVEEIYAGNQKLLDRDVDKLVQAMAGFTPPGAGQTSLPSNYQTALNPVIAANWGVA